MNDILVLLLLLLLLLMGAVCLSLSSRLSQIKNALQNQLDMQFNQLSTTNKPPPKYIVGELESDNDERLLSRNEWEMKLRGVEDKVLFHCSYGLYVYDL